MGRGGRSGGRVQLKHESLQRGEAVVDGLVVRIHILANLFLQGAAVLVRVGGRGSGWCGGRGQLTRV